MDDVVDLVVRKYDSALKAEHGTGRNMAPFVEPEWGPEAVAVMRRLKTLADPDGPLTASDAGRTVNRERLYGKPGKGAGRRSSSGRSCSLGHRGCPSSDGPAPPFS